MKETLKSTKEYRIKHFIGSDQLADLLLRLAAKSNGGHWVSLKEMQEIVAGKNILYPEEFGNHTAEIINGKLLHLDIPFGGGEYKTVLSIEEIDLLESDFEIEEKDFEGLGGLAD